MRSLPVTQPAPGLGDQLEHIVIFLQTTMASQDVRLFGIGKAHKGGTRGLGWRRLDIIILIIMVVKMCCGNGVNILLRSKNLKCYTKSTNRL